MSITRAAPASPRSPFRGRENAPRSCSAPWSRPRSPPEAEITARDASNARTRLKTVAFPVTKTLEEFDLGVSSIPAATVDYLASAARVLRACPALVWPRSKCRPRHALPGR
ncbi:MAG: hypothetical protein ACLPS1_19255 [Streptosporangiaceae bacterium]